MSLTMCTRRLLPRFIQARSQPRSARGPLRSLSNDGPQSLDLFLVSQYGSHIMPVFQGFSDSVRSFHTTPHNAHGEFEWKDPEKEEDVVMLTVHNKEGKVDHVRGKVGDNLLYLCKRFEVDMEGACEASLACTTCHVYVDHEFLDVLPEPSETEEDLLDAAPFLRENSRLGCQIVLCKDYNGMVLRLPAATKNFYVDGHKPAHH